MRSGFEGEKRRVRWPEGSRVRSCVEVMIDTGSEQTFLMGGTVWRGTGRGRNCAADSDDVSVPK